MIASIFQAIRVYFGRETMDATKWVLDQGGHDAVATVCGG